MISNKTEYSLNSNKIFYIDELSTVVRTYYEIIFVYMGTIMNC